MPHKNKFFPIALCLMSLYVVKATTSISTKYKKERDEIENLIKEERDKKTDLGAEYNKKHDCTISTVKCMFLYIKDLEKIAKKCNYSGDMESLNNKITNISPLVSHTLVHEIKNDDDFYIYYTYWKYTRYTRDSFLYNHGTKMIVFGIGLLLGIGSTWGYFYLSKEDSEQNISKSSIMQYS